MLFVGIGLTTFEVSPVMGSCLVCTIWWIGCPVKGSATVTISTEPVVYNRSNQWKKKWIEVFCKKKYECVSNPHLNCLLECLPLGVVSG